MGVFTAAIGLSLSSASLCLAQEKEADFKGFLKELDSGRVERVIFDSINPTELKFYYKNNVEGGVLVRDGFPSFNDPLSPSGPTQAIARCQHAPGVICQVDLSETIALYKKIGSAIQSKPLLQHAAYPKEFAYSHEE